MRFLMFVCNDTVPVDRPDTEPTDIEAWVSGLEARGARITGDPLEHERSARTVRVRGGKRHVTDGPFLETKEVLGGFDVLECADLDEALDIAADHPMATYGVIEVRPVREL